MGRHLQETEHSLQRTPKDTSSSKVLHLLLKSLAEQLLGSPNSYRIPASSSQRQLDSSQSHFPTSVVSIPLWKQSSEKQRWADPRWAMIPGCVNTGPRLKVTLHHIVPDTLSRFIWILDSPLTAKSSVEYEPFDLVSLVGHDMMVVTVSEQLWGLDSPPCVNPQVCSLLSLSPWFHYHRIKTHDLLWLTSFTIGAGLLLFLLLGF